MHLFAILLKGSCAIEVRIVRAADLAAAQAMSTDMVCPVFDSVSVTHLEPQGKEGEVFSACHIE
jgi:hypothetical protein